MCILTVQKKSKKKRPGNRFLDVEAVVDDDEEEDDEDDNDEDGAWTFMVDRANFQWRHLSRRALLMPELMTTVCTARSTVSLVEKRSPISRRLSPVSRSVMPEHRTRGTMLIATMCLSVCSCLALTILVCGKSA